jgi:AraC-like DNA-binding protein
MPKKTNAIPINSLANEFGVGISIERISFTNFSTMEIQQGKQTHRHDGHSFVLLEKGTVSLEIDFKKYIVEPSTLVYVHPDQVHRTIASKDAEPSVWTIMIENLNPEYLNILEDITPTEPIALNADVFSTITEAVSLCIKFSERKNDKLYHSFFNDSCNALIGLGIAQFLEQSEPAKTPTRFEAVHKGFKKALEKNYSTIKRPSEYAQKLNLSTPYLNECVRNVTCLPVSYHIQQRVVLEAKRLLFHSDKSVKEIASELRYDDYPYFSRLFSKVTGMTPLTFRSKNLD